MRELYPMNAAELLDRAVDIYKKSFWMQLAFGAIIWAVGIVALFFLGFALMFVLVIVGIALDGLFLYNEPSMVAIGLGVVAMVIPLLLTWESLAACGHILLAGKVIRGEKATLVKLGLSKAVFRIIGAVFAQFLMALPFTILMIGVLYVAATFHWGFALFLVPLLLAFVIFANAYCLAVSVAAFENKTMFGAIFRSWELVKTDFWRIFGLRALWYIIALFMSTFVQGVVGLAGGAAGGILAPVLATLLIQPMNGIFQATIYFNQRVKNEGYDIELRLERLQS